jgi:hypothetical protein
MNDFEKEIAQIADRKRRLLREARLQRLANEARHDRPPIQRRFQRLVADVLIEGGTRLKARSERERSLRPDALALSGEWMDH